MNTRQISVISSVGGVGVTRLADLLVCDCGSSDFSVFRMNSMSHFHIQCTRCDLVFCPQNKCQDQRYEHYHN